MDIILHFIDEEEFHIFVDSLNNACIAYHDIWGALFLGCDVPERWQDYDEKLIKIRKDVLLKQYKELEKIEQAMN